jgi:hypothetical protein
VMPLDRMPSVSIGVIARRISAFYDTSHYWLNDAGVWHASVHFDAGGYSCGSVQGQPVALRKLAAALVEAADQADQAALAQASTNTAVAQ